MLACWFLWRFSNQPLPTPWAWNRNSSSPHHISSRYFQMPFFSAKENENWSKTINGPTTHTWPPTQPQRSRDGAILTKTPSALQQREGEGTCSTARQHGAPSQQPRHPHTRPRGLLCVAGFGLGQMFEGLLALLGPSASHLAGENNQARAALIAQQFRISKFISASCRDQRCSILVRTSGVCHSVPAHRSRAWCQLPIERHGMRGGHPR